MRHQALRPLAVMLSVLLLAAPARAGSVLFADVAQAIVGVEAGRPRVELRLRNLSQTGKLSATGAAATQQQGGNTSAGEAQNGATAQQPASGASTSTPTTGLEVTQEPTTGQVEVVDFGDVTGTVCDCGEIPPAAVPRGGFPLWPLLGLGAIPLFFLNRDNNPPDVTTTPTPPVPPPPPPPEIPEPATLILFGTSLAALGARARRRRQQHAQAEAEQGINISEGD